MGYLRQIVRDSQSRPSGPSLWTPQAPPDSGTHTAPVSAPEPQSFDQAPSEAAAPERAAPQASRRRILRLPDAAIETLAGARQVSSAGVQPAPAGHAERPVNAGPFPPSAPSSRAAADWPPPPPPPLPPTAASVAPPTPVTDPLPRLPSPGPSTAGGVASPGVARSHVAGAGPHVATAPRDRTGSAPSTAGRSRDRGLSRARSRHAAPPEPDAALTPRPADAYPTPVSATSTRPLAPIPAAPVDRADPEPAEMRIGQVDVFLRDPAPVRAAPAKAARPGPSASRLYLRRL